MAMKTNVLYYGDNLDILERYIPDESVDLVYLDPPFNSNRDYNVIFKDESGRNSDAQLLAFEDTWHWGPSAEQSYSFLTNSAHHGGRVPDTVSQIIAALRSGIGTNQMLAYLVEMTARLVELHRVLKPTGSLYLHCDPTASHYLRVVLDAIFDPLNFRNEIIWKRTGAHNSAKRFGPVHDSILFYVKSSDALFTRVKAAYDASYVETHFRSKDQRGRYQAVALTGPGVRKGDSGLPWRGYDPGSVGRHWQPASYVYSKYTELTGEDLAKYPLIERFDKLDEVGMIYRSKDGDGVPRYRFYLDDAPGVPMQDIWDDLPPVNSQSRDRLGWETQKPVELLERIIGASSAPGDVVLDPFCGCGTALVAAQTMDRKWIGIDITYLSIAVMRARLKDAFGLEDVEVIGQPTEVEGARQLAQSPEGRYQFQWWALALIDAQPLGGIQKKGADQGIDGKITFTDTGGALESVLVSVKSGHVNSSMIRDLKGTLEREKAAIGIFLTLEEGTEPMRQEAATAGVYRSDLWNREYPRVQIITVRELLEENRKPDLPPFVLPTYQKAQKIKGTPAEVQTGMFDKPPIRGMG